MGQHEPKMSDEEIEKELKDFKKNGGIWPLDNVPSFEVWAASLCYDDDKEDGGPAFQTLMHWALTWGSKDETAVETTVQHYKPLPKHIKHKTGKPTANPAKVGHVGGHWTFDDSNRYEAKLQAKARKGELVMSNVAYTPTTFARSSIPGGFAGERNGDYRGFEHIPFDTAGVGKHLGKSTTTKPARWAQTSKTIDPQSTLQFLLTCGVTKEQTTSNGKECGWNSNMSQQFAARGTATGTDRPQNEGCMSHGNRLAAYYGLYFYPDCTNEAYQWHVTTAVGGTKYKIRMRLPNPAYQRANGTLYVNEVLNHYNWSTEEPYLGWSEKRGFPFPRMSPLPYGESQSTERTTYGFLAVRGPTHTLSRISPWASRMGRPKNTPMALFWFQNTDKGNFEADVHDELWRVVNPKFGGRFFKRDDYGEPQTGGLAFGWTPCSALWLWPHTADSSRKLNDGGVQPGYQQWPKWAPGKGPRSFEQWPGDIPFISYLELPPLPENSQIAAVKPESKFARFATYDDLWAALMKKSTKKGKGKGKEVVTIPLSTFKPDVLLDKPNYDLVEDKEADQEAKGLETTREMDEETATGPGSMMAEDIMEHYDMAGNYFEQEKADDLADKDEHLIIMDLREGAQYTAAFDKAQNVNAGNKPLAPGSERRAKDTDGNHHFYSLEHSPWPPEHIYTQPKHEYEFAEMDSERVKDYKEKYGNIANLLLRHSKPHAITGVKQTFGEVIRIGEKSIFDMRLDSYRLETVPGVSKEDWTRLRDVFRANMRRILSIFYDESGNLGFKSAAKEFRYDPAQKKKGMLEGLWASATCDKVSCTVVLGLTEEGKRHEDVHPDPLFWPVFGTRASKSGYKWKNSYVANDEDEKRFTYEGVPKGSRALWTGSKGDVLTGPVDHIVSEMTVLQWLQTPWHYEYLPYQPMLSVFKDGETYCAGCTRCSRPYYEYEHLYAWYLNSHPNTKHWPFQYYRPSIDDDGKKTPWDFRQAPRPFHDPMFWSEPSLPNDVVSVPSSSVDGADSEALLPEKERGYHNWPTKTFLLGWADKDTHWGTYQEGSKKELIFVPSGSKRGPLEREFLERVTKSPVWVKEAQSKGKRWTFREYINHTYNPEEDYDKYMLVQGMIRNRHTRVAFGMEDYRLQRSIKYGNLCRDCAGTLDLAPGLYQRTGRSQISHNLFTGRQARREKALGMDTWWLGLQNQPLKNGETFDPWFIFLETSQDRKFHHYGAGKSREVNLSHTAMHSKKEVLEQLKLNNRERAVIGPLPQFIRKDEVRKLTLNNEELAQKMVERKTSKAEKYELLFGSDWEEMVALHLDAVAEYTHSRHCQLDDAKGKPLTKVDTIEVHLQKTWCRESKKWAQQDGTKMKDASNVLQGFIDWLDQGASAEDDEERSDFVLKKGEWNRALRDMLHETNYELARRHAYQVDPQQKIKKFDPNMYREEWRNWQHDKDGEEYQHCLRTLTLQKPNEVEATSDGVADAPNDAYKECIYCATRAGTSGEDKDKGARWQDNTDWRGDGYILQQNKDGPWTLHTAAKASVDPPKAEKQIRHLTQTRVFITYSLHRRIQSELEARYVMEKMADAVRTLFGNDQWLCQILVFGMRLVEHNPKDSVSSRTYEPITSARKESTRFYGDTNGNSYVFDTYQTHVESVSVDAGIEIGPTYHMPHFHTLVTVNHWSYLQVDTMRMKALLEQMFKGTGRFQNDETYYLQDAAGLPFYTDNENPYIDIRLYPSDNWAEVIAAYVRKTTQPGIFEAQRVRTGME